MARNYARSIPTKILDYMNWGMPFVYSRLELTDELFGHGSGGIGYTPGNVDELAGAIRCLLTDPALHQGLRREAREKVNKFAWESEEAALFRLYDDILSSGEA
jgi:glycosyltransferase involved in cell wall biosynthesis